MVQRKRQQRRSFGRLRRLRSGNWQASYLAPDGVVYKAPDTFAVEADGKKWLEIVQGQLDAEVWLPPIEAAAPMELREYAAIWMKSRTLKPRTRYDYERILDRMILPTFGSIPVGNIKRSMVLRWYDRLDDKTPTMRAHSYALLRSMLGDAINEGLLDGANPAQIRGAGNAKKAHRTKVLTVAELVQLADAMPARYRLMVELAGWCSFRFGELTELRRSDVIFRNEAGVEKVKIAVERGVTRVAGDYVIGTPKSVAGQRTIDVPHHLVPSIREHLKEHAAFGKDGLLFPAMFDPTRHLAPSTLYKVFYPARDKIGRGEASGDPLHFHDLRHTGAVLSAQTGATLAELKARLGHATAGAAMIYQHAVDGADARLADKLADLAINHQGSVDAVLDSVMLRRK